jgi:hypothetical protein
MATTTVGNRGKRQLGCLMIAEKLTFIALPKSAILITQPGMLVNSDRKINAITEASPLFMRHRERGRDSRTPSILK